MVDPLADGDAHWNGFFMGASSSLDVFWETLAGLTDVPPRREDKPPAFVTDQDGGNSLRGMRSIEAVNAFVSDDEALNALVAAMDDQRTVREFTFADAALGEGNRQVYAIADRCTFTKDASTHTDRAYKVSLRWLANDPTIYSEEPSSTWSGIAGSGFVPAEIDLVNEGRVTAIPGRALTLGLNANGAKVVNPYIEINGRRTTWLVEIPNGATLLLGEDRRSRIGSLSVSGRTRGNGLGGLTSSRAARWPEIPPGESTLLVGTAAGVLSISGAHRSTW